SRHRPRGPRNPLAARYWVSSDGGDRLAVLPLSLMTAPTGVEWPAVELYLMSWNVSPTNQSALLVAHVALGSWSPTPVTFDRVRAVSITVARSSLGELERIFAISAPVVQP